MNRQRYGPRTPINSNVVTVESLRKNQNILEIDAIEKKLYFNFNFQKQDQEKKSQLLLYLDDMVIAFLGFLTFNKYSYEQKIDFSESSLKDYVLFSEFLQKDRETLLKKNNSNNKIIFGPENINNPLSALLNYLVFGYEIILFRPENPNVKSTLSQVLEKKIDLTEDVCPKYYRKVTDAVKIFKSIKTAKKTTKRATGNSLSKLLAANSAQILLEIIDCTDHLPQSETIYISPAKNILFLYYYFHFFKKLFVLSNIASLGVPQMVDAILSPNLGEYVQKKLAEEKERIADLEKNLTQLQTKEPSFTVPLNGKFSGKTIKDWGVAAGSNGNFFRYNPSNNTIILANDENFYRKNQINCKYNNNNIDFLETGGEGDCFFHALAAGINLQKDPGNTEFTNGLILRNIFANFLKNTKHNFINTENFYDSFFIDIDYNTLKKIYEKIVANLQDALLMDLFNDYILNELQKTIENKNNVNFEDMVANLPEELKLLIFIYYIKIPGNYIIDAYFPFIFECFKGFFDEAKISFFTILKCDNSIKEVLFTNPLNPISEDEKGLVFVLMNEHYRLAMLLEKNIANPAASTYSTLFLRKNVENISKDKKIAQYETLYKNSYTKNEEFKKRYAQEMRYLKSMQNYEDKEAAKEKIRSSFKNKNWKNLPSPEVLKRLEKYAMLLQAMKIVNDRFDPFGYTLELTNYNNLDEAQKKIVEEQYKQSKSLVRSQDFQTPTGNYNIAPIKINENYYYKFPTIFYEGKYNDFVQNGSYKEFLENKIAQKKQMNKNFKEQAEDYINDNVKILLLETLGPEDEEKRGEILDQINIFLTSPKSSDTPFTDETVDDWKNLLNSVYEKHPTPVTAKAAAPIATPMEVSKQPDGKDRAPFASDVYTSKWLRRTAY